jgi:hypothetical protein
VPTGQAIIGATGYSSATGINIDAAASVDFILTTAAIEFNVNADMTVGGTQFDNQSTIWDVAGGVSVIYDHNGASHLYNAKGTGDIIKRGDGVALGKGWSNFGGFTGNLIIERGTVGGSERYGGNFAIYHNATVIVKDGGQMRNRDNEWSAIPHYYLNGHGPYVAAEPSGDPVNWVGRGARNSFDPYSAGFNTTSEPMTCQTDATFAAEQDALWHGPAMGNYGVKMRGPVAGPGSLAKLGSNSFHLDGLNGATCTTSLVVKETGIHLAGMAVGGDITVKTLGAPRPGWPGWQIPFADIHATKLTVNPASSCTGKLTMEAEATLFDRLETWDNFPVLPPQHLTCGSAQLDAGCIIKVSINDADDVAGVPGTNWCVLDVTGSLDIVGDAANPIVIKMVGLDGTNNPGPVANWAEVARSYTIARAGAMTGFSSTYFLVDQSELPEALGSFTVTTASPDLVVEYNPAGTPPSVDGDVNGDCKVNVLDLIAIRNHLGQDPASICPECDVTGDGQINVLDMIYVRNRLNDVCS